MYRQSQSCIRLAHGLGQRFHVKTGVKQSPSLIILLIDQVLKQAEKELHIKNRGSHSGTSAYATMLD